MPTRTYSRKTAPAGNPADPSKGNPSFLSGIATALPGRTWKTRAFTDVEVDIDGADLTQQEDDDLTAAHTAWVPADKNPPQIPWTQLDETEYSTTKGTWDRVKSFDTPLLPEATYMVMWQVALRSSSGTKNAYVQVLWDSTLIGDASLKNSSASVQNGFHIFSETSGSHSIHFEIKAHSSSARNAAYIADLNVILWRLS